MARIPRKKSYSYHPYCEYFPLLEGEDLDALAEDIKAHGLHHPIVLFNGKILDGRNRYRACKNAGVEPRFEEFKGTDEEALDYAVSLNLTRRHLSTPQRAVLALHLLPAEQEKALARKKAGKKNHLQNFGDGSQQGNSIDIVGKKTRVSGETVRHAQKVAEKAPDVIDAIMAGLVQSMPEATRLSRIKQKRTRVSLVKRARKEGVRVLKLINQRTRKESQAEVKAAGCSAEWMATEKKLIELAAKKKAPAGRLQELSNTLEQVATYNEFHIHYGFIPYRGGKTNVRGDILLLIKRMIDHAGLHDFEFVEPFAGGGSITVNVIANDLAPKARICDAYYPTTVVITEIIRNPGPLMNYIDDYEITKEEADEMFRMLFDPKASSSYMDYFLDAYIQEELHEYDEDVSLFDMPEMRPYLTRVAIAKFIAQKVGVNGLAEMGKFSSLAKIEKEWNPEAFCNHLLNAHELVYDRIVDERCMYQPFHESLKDTKGAFIFADPPYSDSGASSYPTSMTTSDHKRFCRIMKNSVSPFLITYDDSPLIRELYGDTEHFYMQSIQRPFGKGPGSELWIVPADYGDILRTAWFHTARKINL